MWYDTPIGGSEAWLGWIVNIPNADNRRTGEKPADSAKSTVSPPFDSSSILKDSDTIFSLLDIFAFGFHPTSTLHFILSTLRNVYLYALKGLCKKAPCD